VVHAFDALEQIVLRVDKAAAIAKRVVFIAGDEPGQERDHLKEDRRRARRSPR
jgi:hypothetical protein